MKILVQRVKSASVTVSGNIISEIGPGLLSFLGVEKGDSEEQMKKAIGKVTQLRIFNDENGKMNLSLLDSKADHLIVSQFTLAGDCSRGRRPSFHNAAPPELARDLYEKSILHSESLGIKTKGGQFQASMEVELINDGPVTFLIEC